MTAYRNVFYPPSDVPYAIGIAAAGELAYLAADVALTGSLVRQFSKPNAEALAKYDFEVQAYLTVTGTPTITTNVGMTSGTDPTRQIQIAQTTATASEMKSAAVAGPSSLTSSALSAGTRSLLIRGSVQPAAAGILTVDFSSSGTITLLAGSTFRVFRIE
jgi:hypothetical protein